MIALAVWPAFLHLRAASAAAGDPIARLTPAPVKPDYRYRDKNIAFLESRYRKDPADMIIPRMLAGEYLQRYRERGDIGDVVRAVDAGQTSRKVQPRGNVAGDLVLSTAYLTLHRFREAKALVADAESWKRGDPGLALDEASLDLELGEYDAAQRLIDANAGKGTDPADLVAGAQPADVILTRWDEISGHLARAQSKLARIAKYADSLYDMPAERRAWYHFRLGEMLFESGDNDGAMTEEREALARYPNDINALGALARFALANRRYVEAEDAAAKAVALTPSPEVLGILADAEEARGEGDKAAATRDLIGAVEKIGNAQRVNDRLLALYYADHDVRLDDAYAIAKRELAVRDDIFTEDTLAWTAAKAGKWDVARIAIAKALRFDTEDPRIQYHAGFVAEHVGDAAEAKKRYRRALALNPNFSALYAEKARAALGRL